jgi:membrane protein implicated in regulation of membrane protease activity
MNAVLWLLAISAAVGFLVGIYLSWLAIAAAGLILALGSAITLNINGFGDFAGIAITVATLVVSQVAYLCGVALAKYRRSRPADERRNDVPSESGHDDISDKNKQGKSERSGVPS